MVSRAAEPHAAHATVLSTLANRLRQSTCRARDWWCGLNDRQAQRRGLSKASGGVQCENSELIQLETLCVILVVVVCSLKVKSMLI